MKTSGQPHAEGRAQKTHAAISIGSPHHNGVIWLLTTAIKHAEVICCNNSGFFQTKATAWPMQD